MFFTNDQIGPSAIRATGQVVAETDVDSSGSGTVLVSEDQPDLRRCVRQMLEGNNYCVLESANGAEALVVARGYKGVIDLLLTDIVMPEMDGLVFAQRSLAQTKQTKSGGQPGTGCVIPHAHTMTARPLR
jgi:CheY-like chemotaxis protein